MLMCLCAWSASASTWAQFGGNLPPADPMLDVLEQMLADDPQRADSWRLLGGLYRKHDRIDDALAAFNRSLQLQLDNAATHSDLGELLEQLGHRDAASHHYDQVMLLAPSSSYAARLVEQGIRPAPRLNADHPPSAGMPRYTPRMSMPNALDRATAPWDEPHASTDGSADVDLIDYSIQTFDGALELERRLNDLQSDASAEPNRLRAFIEFGTLYNTNVSLTPISRELTGDEAASFQGFLSPDLQWIALRHDAWRAGPMMRGYFTVNQEDFQSLNLASFQPGVFAEHDLPSCWESTMIGRLEYIYSLDLLDGDRFGDRHAVTASLTTILPEFDVIYAFVTASDSDFAEDGVDPSVNSLDGPALMLGISRFYTTDWSLMPTWTLGTDFEFANTVGADYRYQAVSLFGDATFQLGPRLSFIPRAGVGYRSYGDYTGPVSRDELPWRVGGRLRWQWTDNIAISAVVGHNRFVCDNEEFASERTEAGIVFTVTH